MRRDIGMMLCGFAILGLVGCQPAPTEAPVQPTESKADREAKAAAANEATFRRMVDEVFSQGKIETIDALLAPDFVEHQMMPPGFPTGAAGLKQFVGTIRASFPDLVVTVDQVVASGDVVAGRSTWTGTFQNEFMGMKPSGQKVTFEAYDFVRMKDGKAVEHWGLDNSAMVLMAPPAGK